jgi:hypothetical protein
MLAWRLALIKVLTGSAFNLRVMILSLQKIFWTALLTTLLCTTIATPLSTLSSPEYFTVSTPLIIAPCPFHHTSLTPRTIMLLKFCFNHSLWNPHTLH